jgi:hypothetical protein
MLHPGDFDDIDRRNDMGNDEVYDEYDQFLARVYTDASDMVSLLDQARRLAEHAHEAGWSVEQYEAALDGRLGMDDDDIERFSEWVSEDPFC